MGRLKIIADGDSLQAKNNARGKLFEKLIKNVLCSLGYRIDGIPSTNYAGMEIDIEGRHKTSDIPLYVECKCYETEITVPKLQQFFGKYMTRWLKDNRSQGLFVAIPNINSHAKGFWKDNIENNPRIAISLLEENKIINLIYDTSSIATHHTIRKINQDMEAFGDWVLLYTDKGFFYVQYIIPVGRATPNQVALFDASGNLISEKEMFEYIASLYQELNDFKWLMGKSDKKLLPAKDLQEELVVEVKGSSECFEYQFPASPNHFVGRELVLNEFENYISKLLKKDVSSHGILFEANSGWGKSSVVLACVKQLIDMGHYAIAIDSRTASSSQFILRVMEHVLKKCFNLDEIITGYEGMANAIIARGKWLEKEQKLLVIFFDQFENVFLLNDVLTGIRNLFLKLCDIQTNVIFGYSWKTDLIGSTNEFPYILRDDIKRFCKVIPLGYFSEIETGTLLDKLEHELNSTLRKDLRFFLSEFSQGYPWLLKKLCAHVKAQRKCGISQTELSRSLLNVEELFLQDLNGLSANEEQILRDIAKVAPISIMEIDDRVPPEIVQSLVDRRLLVRIGNKYDLYWDIFRDYLNTGRLPIQENYILRSQVRTVFKATKILVQANGELDISMFREKTALSEKSFYNIAKDMGLLGIAEIKDGLIALQIDLPKDIREIEVSLRNHLQDKLKLNRLAWEIFKVLENRGALKMNEIADLLKKSCPYISATGKTWMTYARIFSGWMDSANLALLDNKPGCLVRYEPGIEIRERQLLLAKRRGATTPRIQYGPVEKIMVRIFRALQEDKSIDWAGLKKSTIFKALATLEDMGFILRKSQSIEVLPKGREFVIFPETRPVLFAEGAFKLEQFRVFIEILEQYKNTDKTLFELASELRRRLNVNWKMGTAITNAKILLNWAKNTGYAPRSFCKRNKG